VATIGVAPKSKAIKVTGWQDRRFTLEDLPREFSNPSTNIGVLLGEPSGGLYDVDIDCTEALAVADAFLPATGAEFGRKSKLRSHRFYICTGVDEGTRQFRDPNLGKKDEKSMLIELRGSGGQTMLPPSVHPFGEAVEWASPTIAPAEITHPELLRATQRTAAAALLARYYPNEGSRNAASMALSGALLRGG
jgi:putative DNA primase/helicase